MASKHRTTRVEVTCDEWVNFIAAKRGLNYSQALNEIIREHRGATAKTNKDQD